MSEADRLFQSAKAAMARAYAPYSRFPVGAAILDDRGGVHTGCNVENGSFPEGWCAETSALAAMIMAGGRRITAVAVVAERMSAVTPCGGCRQRLAEFGDRNTAIHLCHVVRGVVRTVTLGDLLPLGFALEDASP